MGRGDLLSRASLDLLTRAAAARPRRCAPRQRRAVPPAVRAAGRRTRRPAAAGRRASPTDPIWDEGLGVRARRGARARSARCGRRWRPSPTGWRRVGGDRAARRSSCRSCAACMRRLDAIVRRAQPDAAARRRRRADRALDGAHRAGPARQPLRGAARPGAGAAGAAVRPAARPSCSPAPRSRPAATSASSSPGSGLSGEDSPVTVREIVRVAVRLSRRSACSASPTTCPSRGRTSAAHGAAVVQVVTDLAYASDGGMFVLFTSHASLRRAAQRAPRRCWATAGRSWCRARRPRDVAAPALSRGGERDPARHRFVLGRGGRARPRAPHPGAQQATFQGAVASRSRRRGSSAWRRRGRTGSWTTCCPTPRSS